MKKFFPYIAGVVIMVSCFSFLALSAHAAEDTYSEETSPECFSLEDGLNIGGCAAKGGYWVLRGVSSLLYIAGGILNYAIKVAILEFGGPDGYINKEGIKAGWAICRDVANLFFIFILLYIAIATILRLQGYGMKQLLVKVVLMALLVNFSGFTTKVIIDATNIFALEFYQNIQGQNAQGKQVGVADVFVQGLRLTTVYKGYEKTNGAPVKQQASVMGVIIGTFGGSVLILIATFILFAFAIMFITRTVALLFIYIFSPLAFLAMALPKTQSYASQWWKKLFEQAIFAPVCMFMIYLTAKIISTNSLLTATDSTVNDGLLDILFKGVGEGANMIIYFVILAGFMLGSLKIATSMSAYGAKWSNKKMGEIGTWAKSLPKRTGRRLAGGAADAFATGEAEGKGRIARGIAATGRGLRQFGDTKVGGLVGAGGIANLATRGAANLAQANKSRIAEIQKGYEKYSDNQLRNMVPGKLSPFARTAAIQELAKRGKLTPARDKTGNIIPGVGNITEQDIVLAKKIASRYGLDTKDINRARPDLIEKADVREKVIKAMSAADMEKMDEGVLKAILANKETKEIALKSWSAAHYEKMNPKVVTDILKDTENMKTIISGFSGKDMKKVMDMGGQMEKMVMNYLGSEKVAGAVKNIDNVVKHFEEIGNKSLVSWAKSSAARPVLEGYIGGASEKPPERFYT